jgi:hypothetical protein
MITRKELLGKYKESDIPEEYVENSNELLEKLNKIRKLYGKPMIPTNSFRSLEHHLEIYAKKGITDQSKIPMKSKHLYFQACDIYDPNRDLMKWCKANEDVLEEVGLWCEEEDSVPRVHFQIVPPKSGKRFFLP